MTWSWPLIGFLKIHLRAQVVASLANQNLIHVILSNMIGSRHLSFNFTLWATTRAVTILFRARRRHHFDIFCINNGSSSSKFCDFFLQKNPFTRLSLEEKKKIKDLGPDQPDLQIQQQASDRGRSYTRSFTRACYEKRRWLAGCDISNSLFCFPCLLFQSVGTEVLWTTTGVRDLKHLSEKCKRTSLLVWNVYKREQYVQVGNMLSGTSLLVRNVYKREQHLSSSRKHAFWYFFIGIKCK